jgi:hypothetical protein
LWIDGECRSWFEFDLLAVSHDGTEGLEHPVRQNPTNVSHEEHVDAGVGLPENESIPCEHTSVPVMWKSSIPADGHV